MNRETETKESAKEHSAAAQEKAAVLVIHGIGEQNPYETVDQFARGLVDHFPGARSEPLMVNHEGWNEVAIRLHLNGTSTRHGFSVLDLYEFYWAPHTEGKTTYLQVLIWLRRTVLTPLRYLGYGYELFSRSRQLGRAFVREMLRSLFLFLPVALLTSVLVHVLNKAEGAYAKSAELLKVFRDAPWMDQVLLLLFAAFVILSWANLKGLRVLRKERAVIKAGRLRGLGQQSLTRWTGYTFLSLVLTVVITAVLGLVLRRHIVDVWGRVPWWQVFPPVILGSMALWLRGILVNYLGDVAVYVNADAKAASFQARSAILKEGREALLRLINSPEGYTRIVIAGHSLGSVIAYDLLNRLLNEVRAPYGTGPQGVLPNKLSAAALQRVQGLVTFGSPLDKIYYFFRTEASTEQAIRSQILSFMHGFRRAPSGRSYGNYRFPPYTIPDPSPDFKWINIWAAADPVSGHLDFYQVAGAGSPNPVANQFERPYPWHRWGYAHLMYWSDREFYRLVADELL
jgi:hypothetical protein